MQLDSKIPDGPIAEKWTKHKMDSRLINPNNKRKYTVLVVGSGLAGASLARDDVQGHARPQGVTHSSTLIAAAGHHSGD